MKINSISQNLINFKGDDKPKVKDRGAKAFASLVLPGTGQFCDGRKEDGKKYLAAYAGAGTILSLLTTNSKTMIAELITGKLPSLKQYLPILGISFAIIGIGIASARDAYKGGKINATKQVTPEETKTPRGGKIVASALLPGLGQLIDGKIKEGLGFLAGFIGLEIIINKVAKFLLDCNTTKIPTPLKILTPITSLAFVGLKAASIVDAYKGKKQPEKAETTIPKK